MKQPQSSSKSSSKSCMLLRQGCAVRHPPSAHSSQDVLRVIMYQKQSAPTRYQMPHSDAAKQKVHIKTKSASGAKHYDQTASAMGTVIQECSLCNAGLRLAQAMNTRLEYRSRTVCDFCLHCWLGLTVDDKGCRCSEAWQKLQTAYNLHPIPQTHDICCLFC